MSGDELAILARSGQAVASPVANRKRRRGTGGHSPVWMGRRAQRGNRRALRSTPPDPEGPHIRFGVGWALITLAAIFGGTVWLALWLSVAAALATGSTIHSWRGRGSSRPFLPIAAGLAAAIVLAAIAGPVAALAVGGAVVVVVVASAPFLPGVPGVVRRVLIVVGPAAAGAGFVLARRQGFDEALVLAGMVVVYDSAAYLIGTGANNRWEGPIAGLVSVGILSLLVAAVLVPPFTGSSPWILGGLAAVLLPLGPMLCRRLVGDRRARVPALRRLDSLVLLGPAWPAAVALLLH